MPVTLFDPEGTLTRGATRPDLSPFIRNNPCPETGGGVHRWIFSAVKSLRGIGFTDENEIARIVEEHATRKDSKEIGDAIRNTALGSENGSSFQGQGTRHKPQGVCPKAEVDREAIEAASKRFGGIAALRLLSPADMTSWSTENLIDALFPGNPLLCFAKSEYSFKTRDRDYFRGTEANYPLLVPSPMSKRTGLTKEGKPSEHCLDNTGPRRFLVIESDDKKSTQDHKASVILHLAETAPLVMVLFSGKESLHAWFYCDGQEEDALLAFHTRAVGLGADSATWTRCQFIRMPGAIRPDTGKVQELLFLHPTACPGFPSVPTPEGYCAHCWNNNAAMPLRSQFPCSHQRRAS